MGEIQMERPQRFEPCGGIAQGDDIADPRFRRPSGRERNRRPRRTAEQRFGLSARKGSRRAEHAVKPFPPGHLGDPAGGDQRDAVLQRDHRRGGFGNIDMAGRQAHRPVGEGEAWMGGEQARLRPGAIDEQIGLDQALPGQTDCADGIALPRLDPVDYPFGIAHARRFGLLNEKRAIGRRVPAQRVVDSGQGRRFARGWRGKATRFGQRLRHTSRRRRTCAKRANLPPFPRERGLERRVERFAIGEHTLLLSPAPPGIAGHQPVRSARLGDDLGLGDAQPVMQLVGEGHGAGRPVGKGGWSRLAADHNHLASRQTTAQGQCGEHAHLPAARHDHAAQRLARGAHAASASRAASARR
jgi:hypothetical protein